MDPTNYIERDCTITHEGRTFEAMGAIVSDDYLVCYLANPLGGEGDKLRHGIATDWHGNKIGGWTYTSSWRNPRGWMSTHMHAVSVLLDDGRLYKGRSGGVGMIFKGKRAASQRKGSK